VVLPLLEIESVESGFEVFRTRDVHATPPGAFDDDVESSREHAVRVFAFGQDNFFEVIKPITVRAAKFLGLSGMMIEYFP